MSDLETMLKQLAEEHKVVHLDFNTDDDDLWNAWLMPEGMAGGMIECKGMTPRFAVQNLITKIKEQG